MDFVRQRIENAECAGIEIGGCAHQHGSEAHEAVERRHELRHRGHFDPAGDHETDAAAHDDGADDLGQAHHVMGIERGGDGDAHADHAHAIAATAGRGAGQPAQREDEKDARDQIGERDEG